MRLLVRGRCLGNVGWGDDCWLAMTLNKLGGAQVASAARERFEEMSCGGCRLRSGILPRWHA
jgi:hypothetical protein